jgi:hypothetical protein
MVNAAIPIDKESVRSVADFIACLPISGHVLAYAWRDHMSSHAEILARKRDWHIASNAAETLCRQGLKPSPAPPHMSPAWFLLQSMPSSISSAVSGQTI